MERGIEQKLKGYYIKAYKISDATCSLHLELRSWLFFRQETAMIDTNKKFNLEDAR